MSYLRLSKFGSSVDISSDGSVVAVGHPHEKAVNSSNSFVAEAGRVHIYDTSQTALPDSAVSYGPSEFDSASEPTAQQIGFSVAVSGDGTRVIAGTGEYGRASAAVGKCRVITKSAGGWNTSTDDIEEWTENVLVNTTPSDFGSRVAISNDGTRYAVLASNGQDSVPNSGWQAGLTTSFFTGHLYVYDHPVGGSRTQTGSIITGHHLGETRGIKGGGLNRIDAIAMSGDGTTIAITKPDDHSQYEFTPRLGRVSVYVYDSATSDWIAKGTSIYGDHTVYNTASANVDTLGRAVALNTDGTVLAVASDKHIYRYEINSSNQWVMSASAELFTDFAHGYNKDSRSIDISGDGSVIITGSGYETADNSASGAFQVFEYANNILAPIGLDDFADSIKTGLYSPRSGDYAMRGHLASKSLGSSCALSSDKTKAVIGANEGSTLTSGTTISNRDYTGLAQIVDLSLGTVPSWSGTGSEADPFVIASLPTRLNTTDPNQNMVELGTTSGGYVSITTGSWSFGDVNIQNDEQGWATFVYSDTYHNNGVLESTGPVIPPSAVPYTSFIYVPPGKVLRIDKLNATGQQYSAAQANDVSIFISPTQITTSVDLLTETGDSLQAESGDNLIHSASIAIAPTVIITSQPQDQTTSTPGAQFSVTAESTNDSEVSYQWQVSTDNGGTFSDIQFSTGRVLTLSGSNYENDGNKYRVIVSAPGAVPQTSSYANLTYNQPVAEFTTDPQSVQTVSGEATFFSIATLSDGTTGQYQWQKSTDAGATWTDITGATTANLALTGLTASDNASKYRSSFIPDATGLSQVFSNVASLSVVTYTITQHPADTESGSGFADFRVEVSASDNSRPTITWQKSVDGGSSWTTDTMPSPTNNTVGVLILNSVTYSDNGNQYRAAITKPGFSGVAVYSNAAVLTVEQPYIAITTSPAHATAVDGEATLRINAVHSTGAALSYQWQVSDYDPVTATSSGNILNLEPSEIAPSRPNLLTGETVPGVTNDPTSNTLELVRLYSYLLPGYPGADGGTNVGVWGNGANASNFAFRCEVSAGEFADPVYTGWVQITVPAVTLTLDSTLPADFEPTTEPRAVFTVDATATQGFTDNLFYQWQQSLDSGTTWSDYGEGKYHDGGNGSQRLTIYDIEQEFDNRQYRCQVTAANFVTAQTSRAATLTVPQFLASATDPTDQTTTAGTSVSFTVDASATTPSFASVAYLWEQSEDGGTTWNPAHGNRLNSVYTVVNGPYYANGYKYRCTVTAGGDSYTTAAATLTVSPPTVSFTTNLPTSKSFNPHKSLFFRATAVASDGSYPDYEWQTQEAGSSTWVTRSTKAMNKQTIDLGYAFGSDGDKIRVKVSVNNGTEVVSNECLIDVVDPILSFHSGEYPNLTSNVDSWNPSSVNVSGSTATISARAVISDSGLNTINQDSYTGRTPSYTWHVKRAGEGSYSFVTNDAAQGSSYSTQTITTPGDSGETRSASVLTLTGLGPENSGDLYYCSAVVDVRNSANSADVQKTASSSNARITVPIGLSSVGTTGIAGVRALTFYGRSHDNIRGSWSVTGSAGTLGPLSLAHDYKKIVSTSSPEYGGAYFYAGNQGGGFFGIGTDGIIYGFGSETGVRSTNIHVLKGHFGFGGGSGEHFGPSSFGNDSNLVTGAVHPDYKQFAIDREAWYQSRQSGNYTAAAPTYPDYRSKNHTPVTIAYRTGNSIQNWAWVHDGTDQVTSSAALSRQYITHVVDKTQMTFSTDSLVLGQGTMGSQYNKFVDISYSAITDYGHSSVHYTNPRVNPFGVLVGVTSDGRMFGRSGPGAWGLYIIEPKDSVRIHNAAGYASSPSKSGWAEILHPLAGVGRKWRKVYVQGTHCHAIDDQNNLYGWGSRLFCGDPSYKLRDQDPDWWENEVDRFYYTNQPTSSTTNHQPTCDVTLIAANVSEVSGNLALKTNGDVHYIHGYSPEVAVEHSNQNIVGLGPAKTVAPMQRVVEYYGEIVDGPASSAPVYMRNIQKVYGLSPSTYFAIKTNGTLVSWAQGPIDYATRGDDTIPRLQTQIHGEDDYSTNNTLNHGTIGRLLTSGREKAVEARPVDPSNISGLTCLDVVANQHSVLALYKNSANVKFLVQWGSNAFGAMAGQTIQSGKILQPTKINDSAFISEATQVRGNVGSMIADSRHFLIAAQR